jgi:hypothetical protein
MALETQTPPEQQPVRRIWKAPLSWASWLWLLASLVIYSGVYMWFLNGLKTQKYPGPTNDPFRLFGIIAFVLVLITAAYTLRRRFVRQLSGKVQDWLWLHIWMGIISLLVAFLHVNYDYVVHDYCLKFSCYTEAAGGRTALYALLVLVLSGIVGRLLDVWQAHVIANEASANGVGILQAVEEHLFEVRLAVERLSAGKSETFKEYINQRLNRESSSVEPMPMLIRREHDDFMRAYEHLMRYEKLLASFYRQKRAHWIIRIWRYVHIPLACAALAVIAVHGLAELLKMLLAVCRRETDASCQEWYTDVHE